jgi:RHS repeat-associated protein
VGTADTSGSGSAPSALFDTDEFGVQRAGASPQRYGWLGSFLRGRDASSGLVVMGRRVYSPSAGRFLQTDPIVGGSANPYDYAAQDPANLSDVDGTSVGTPYGKCIEEFSGKKIGRIATGRCLVYLGRPWTHVLEELAFWRFGDELEDALIEAFQGTLGHKMTHILFAAGKIAGIWDLWSILRKFAAETCVGYDLRWTVTVGITPSGFRTTLDLYLYQFSWRGVRWLDGHYMVC